MTAWDQEQACQLPLERDSSTFGIQTSCWWQFACCQIILLALGLLAQQRCR